MASEGLDEPVTPTHVLIVEDDENLAALMGRWLREHHDDGVVVHVAHSIDAGSRTIADLSTVDVVLLDRHFPSGTGVDLLDALRDRFDPIVVMVTGVEPDTELIRFPVADYLVKPIDRSHLITRVLLLEKLARTDALDAYSNARKASLLEHHLDDPSTDPLYRRFAAQWAYDRLELAASSEGVYVYELYTDEDTGIRVSLVGTLAGTLEDAVANEQVVPVGEVVPDGESFGWIDVDQRSLVDPPSDGYVIYEFTDTLPERLVMPATIGDHEAIETALERAYG